MINMEHCNERFYECQVVIVFMSAFGKFCVFNEPNYFSDEIIDRTEHAMRCHTHQGLSYDGVMFMCVENQGGVLRIKRVSDRQTENPKTISPVDTGDNNSTRKNKYFNNQSLPNYLH